MSRWLGKWPDGFGGLMSWVVRSMDDAEWNIFEGLRELDDDGVDLPSEWLDDADDSPEMFRRDALNGRFDLEVDCWECRLA